MTGSPLQNTGAGKESRTPDLNLGKVALYQLSYSRVGQPFIIAKSAGLSKSKGLPQVNCGVYAITFAIASATRSMLRELSAATQMRPVSSP